MSISHLIRVDWNGCPPLPLNRVRLRLAVRRAHKHRLVVTATTNGVHAPHSYHSLKRAVDFGVPANEVGTQHALAKLMTFQLSEWKRNERRWRRHLRRCVELLGPRNHRCFLNSHPTSLIEGSALETQHDNHVHLAF